MTHASQGHLLNSFLGDGHHALETTVFKAQDSSDLPSIVHPELPTQVKTPNGVRRASFIGLIDL